MDSPEQKTRVSQPRDMQLIIEKDGVKAFRILPTAP